MKRLKRLHGMHWHIVSRLGMRREICLEMEWRNHLRCRNTRVKLKDVHVNLLSLLERAVFLLLWVARIGVASAYSIV